MYRSLLLSSLALVAALALAEVASADTFCVTPEGSCPPAQTYAALQPALDAATGNGSDDTIRLGAALYTAPTVNGFVYFSGDETLEIVGKGPTTVVTAPAGVQQIFALDSLVAGSSVHDLRVHLPASVANAGSGIRTSGFEVAHVTVDGDVNQSNSFNGVQLFSGGTLRDSTISLDTSVDSAGVIVEPNTEVSDSKITGHTGVIGLGGTVERVSVIGNYQGIAFHGNMVVRNCLVRLVPGVAGQSAINVGSTANAKVANLTLIGNGGAASYGVQAYSNNTSTTLDVAGVVIHGFSNALFRRADPGVTTTITIHHSDYDPSNLLEQGSGSIVQGAGNAFHPDPGFYDVAVGDYSLEDNSPLIDRGDPAAGFGATDLAGHVRVFDGDGDGSAVPDIGAYEYGAPAPGAGGGGGSPAGGSAPVGGGGAAPSSNDTRSPDTSSGPAVSPDRRAPVISRLRVRSRWLRLTVDEAALIRVRIQHRTRTGLHLVRRLRVKANGGALRIALGRLHDKRYRVVVSATDAAGNHSAPIARTLVRR